MPEGVVLTAYGDRVALGYRLPLPQPQYWSLGTAAAMLSLLAPFRFFINFSDQLLSVPHLQAPKSAHITPLRVLLATNQQTD